MTPGTDLRCRYKMHGILLPERLIEVKCKSKLCGAGSGVTVLHRFSAENGQLVETLKFKDPGKESA